ncbi:fibronectin type III domain-containing protein [Halorubrum trueperi]|uniref:Fibronectin type III domain-containing protein n=1 Tax=Halorubrum trueperi TaxID=2004704 RepID=A0ABD5UJF4_9EURY
MPTETFTADADYTIPSTAKNIRIEARGEPGEDGVGDNQYGDGGGGQGGVAEINAGDALAGQTVYVRMGYGGGSGYQEFDVDSGNGGGAADVRVGGTSLSDRVVVGAGGGGGGASGDSTAYNGGSGGPDTGGNGGEYQGDGGHGGTQSSGGTGGDGDTDSRDGSDGSFGAGGNGGNYGGNSAGGGGGSGWYGGGGGGARANPDFAGGGGGGSNYTDPSYTEVTNQRGGEVSAASVTITYDQIPETPTGATADADGESTIDVGWDAADRADGYELYRSLSSPVTTNDTLVVDTASTSYTDTGLLNGRTYHYAVLSYNNAGDSGLSGEAVATTVLPAPSVPAVSDVDADSATYAWDATHTNGETRVEYREDGGEWAVAETVAFDTEQAAPSNLLNGQLYDARVVAQTSDAESPSTVEAFQTLLPDEPQQQLDNGVLDEITVNRDPSTNNGIVRYQIRETGASAWDSSAAGFAEETAGYDADVVFTGLLDGEEYETRGRTETDYATGAWTEPLSIITRFPGADDLTATNTTTTSVTLGWTEYADNEDGQLVIRERRLSDGSWGRERELADVGVNTETYTDDTAQADREYRYRIRSYTAYAEADSNTVTVSTPALDGVRDRHIPVTGPYVEIDTTDQIEPLTPTVTDYDWSPNVNERPSVKITVPESDRWEELKGQPMRVWIDGTQLPIDTLEGTRTTTGDRGSATVLEASGASQLDPYTDDIQFEARENHLAGEELIAEYTDYDANVDDPATDTRSDVLMLQESGVALEEPLADAIDPTDPLEVRQIGGIRRLQTGWFVEAEDAETNLGVYLADNYGDAGAWSGGQALRLNSVGDEFEVSISTDHEIPEGELVFDLLEAVEGEAPAFDISFDGDVVESIPTGGLNSDADQFDLSWGPEFFLNEDGAVAPGSHTVTVTVTTETDGDMWVDATHIRDDRDSFVFDDTPENGVVQGPEQFPGVIHVVFDDVGSVEQVIAGEFTVEMSSTAGDQAVAISNDEGANWIEASNSESVSGSFAGATQQIRARVTLSGYAADPSSSPARGDSGQSVDEIDLRADLEDTPVLLDKQYRDRLSNVLAEIADGGRMVWEARRDPDADPNDETGIIIEWTQIGQRTRASTAPTTSLEKRTTIEDTYERVIVFGRSKDVEGSTFAQSGGSTLTSIGDEWVVPDSERIYDPDTDEVFERGEDYRMQWDVGGIEILDGGDMSTGTTYAADYEFKYRGEATTPTVDPAEARTVERTISGATSDRECDQLALSILKEVQDAQVEATITLVEPAPDVSLVEAISHPRLPEGAQEIRGVERSSTDEREYRLANRQTASEIVDDLREDYESLADVV